jgi:hypothetical protein
LSAAKAARRLGTLMFVRPLDVTATLKPYADSLIPCLTRDDFAEYGELIRSSRVVELADAPGIEIVFAAVRRIHNPVCC